MCFDQAFHKRMNEPQGAALSTESYLMLSAFPGLFDSRSCRWRSNCHTCDQIQTKLGEEVANNPIVNWFVRPVNFMKLRIPAR